MAALELKNLSFAYPSGEKVLDCVSLSIEPAEFALVVGDTGSGKTTLLRLIKPEIAPAGKLSGEVSVFGEDVYSRQSARISEYVGYVFQNPDSQIVSDTVMGELAFGLECRGVDTSSMRKKIAEAVSFFGMTEWASSKIESLSGGQKQLVNLASILLLQPSLLLLDEPTEQLDPISARLFLDMLFHVNKDLGVAVIVATHNPEELSAFAQRVFEIDGGKLGERPSRMLHESPAFLSFDDGWSQAGHQKPAGVQNAEIVTFNDAAYAYSQSRRPVLQNLSMTVREGQVVVLVGGNGSGKTTALKLAAKILSPLSGRVSNACEGCQAYLPQDPQVLFSCDTVADELLEWRRSAGYPESAIFEIARQLNLTDCLDSNPFDASGGQQQAIALAKLMLCDPKLLILDEPVKGFDPKMCFAVARKLKGIVRCGATVLMSTHNLGFAACLADRIVMLFNGDVAADQAPADFFKDNYFYLPRRTSFTRMWQAWIRGDRIS